MTALAPPSGYQYGIANAVNDSGQIVGNAGDASHQFAALWQNGTGTDLNSLLPANSGWTLQTATGINDSGLIVGYGLYKGAQTAFEMSLDGLTAPLHTAQAVAELVNSGAAHIPQQSVIDSAADVSANLDGLQSGAAAGTLGGITLTDSGTPNLTVTAAQITADKAVLNDISGPHAVTVQMSGTAAGHNFSGENWTGANALQFADQTVIVAATPGGANNVTTGNVTELYSAVLAREPDIGGLAYYQNDLKTNPSTPLQTVADYFLNSTEYKSHHSYATGTAGDTQFITDSYQNLLHRTPSADEINFYLTNVMSKPDAHALMLVYFSASSEFLSDVQITAQNPASAQHWLLLT
jgi:probable HAF family extracellular repeat protein